MKLAEATVRIATVEDAPMVAGFGARTFSEAFAAENTPEDMALYLERAYGVAQQSREIRDPAMTTIVAECERALAGFAQMRVGRTPGCVVGSAPVELLRFYVDRPWQGRGLARTLMSAVDREAVRRRAGVVWLAVWERNARAISFYRKCGFAGVGNKVFMLGTDRQNDIVMAAPVPLGRREE